MVISHSGRFPHRDTLRVLVITSTISPRPLHRPVKGPTELVPYILIFENSFILTRTLRWSHTFSKTPCHHQHGHWDSLTTITSSRHPSHSISKHQIILTPSEFSCICPSINRTLIPHLIIIHNLMLFSITPCHHNHTRNRITIGHPREFTSPRHSSSTKDHFMHNLTPNQLILKIH